MDIVLSADEFYRLAEYLEDAQVVETADSVRSTYPGRGMYGKTCLAVDLEETSRMLGLGVALAQVCAAIGMGADWIDGARTDSMGRGIVVYWPRVRVNDDSGEA